MVDGIGNVIDAMFWFCGISLLIFVPLGTWKAVEIIIWLCKHVEFVR